MSSSRTETGASAWWKWGWSSRILILLAIGLSEIGFLVVDYLTVTNAAREGARTGAAAANFDTGPTDADDLILDAVEEASCNLRFGDLEKVRIFKADGLGDPICRHRVNEYSPRGALACDSPGNDSGIVTTAVRGLATGQRPRAARARCPRCRGHLLS